MYATGCRPRRSTRTVFRGIGTTALAAIFALAAFAQRARADDPDPYVFESSAAGDAGGGGLSVGANPAGFTFRVTERIAISEIGAELSRLGSNDYTVYAALYRVGTPVSTPDVVSDGTLIATTLLTVDSATPVDASAPLSATLEPGWYSIVVGSGRHGANAPAFAVTLNDTGQPTAAQTWGPYTVNATTNAGGLQGVRVRLFLRGQALPPTSPPPTDFLAQTALPYAWWASGFWSIDASHFFAMRFSLAKNTRVSRTSAWFYKGGSGSVFAAILRTSSSSSTLPSPGTQAFNDAVVASTLVPVGADSEEYAGVFDDVALAPGSYALVYGTGAFGASGTANPMTIASDDLVGSGAWQWLNSTWLNGFDVRLTLSGIVPQLEVTPDPVDFGTVPIGVPATRALTVRNVGDGALQLGALGVSGADTARFTLGADACSGASLAASATCTVSVTYVPDAVGSQVAQLAIASDGVPNPYVVALFGNGAIAHTVTPSADGDGAIAPDTPQIVAEGAQAQFTLTPQTGRHVAGVDSDCGGALSGNVFTTDAVMHDCSVVAHFAIDTFAVTPGSSGHGTIDPADVQTVEYGGSAAFHLQPDVGYHIAGVGGDCPGELAGNTFTAGPIVAACSVVANFALDAPSAIAAVSGTPQSAIVGNAFAAPLTVRVTNDGGLGVPGVSVAFVAPASGASALIATNAVTDADGYASVAAAANAVVGSYIVSASVEGVGGAAQFALENRAPNAAIAVSIDDGRDDAAYGHLLDYRIVVRNDGSDVANGVAVAAALPEALDAAQASWICLDAASGACAASGSGALDDHANVPAHGSVTYLLSVPVRADAEGVSFETSVQTAGPYADYAANATDTDVLVVFRDGFDAADVLVLSGWLTADDVVPLPLGAEGEAPGLRTLIAARAFDCSGFRIEALQAPDGARLRVVVFDATHPEQATPWAAATETPSLAFASGDEGVTLLLEGTQPALDVALASTRTHWRVRAAASIELPMH